MNGLVILISDFSIHVDHRYDVTFRRVLPPSPARAKGVVDRSLGPVYQAKLLNLVERAVFAVV